MRFYKKKPYKIKPYGSYRRKSRKMRIFLIGLLCVLLGIILLGYILPNKGIVPWKPLFKIEIFKSEYRTIKQVKDVRN